jgi:hypothetical protein
MKINTNTKIKNLVGEEFAIIKDGKESKLLLGDVLFSALSNSTGVELKISWALLPKLALEDEDILLEDQQKNALVRSLEQMAQLPQSQRYNLIVYGRCLDILNNKVEETKKGKK